MSSSIELGGSLLLDLVGLFYRRMRMRLCLCGLVFFLFSLGDVFHGLLEALFLVFGL